MTPLGYYEESNFPANTTYVIGAGVAGEIGYSIVAFWATSAEYQSEAALKKEFIGLLTEQGYEFLRITVFALYPKDVPHSTSPLMNLELSSIPPGVCQQ